MTTKQKFISFVIFCLAAFNVAFFASAANTLTASPSSFNLSDIGTSSDFVLNCNLDNPNYVINLYDPSGNQFIGAADCNGLNTHWCLDGSDNGDGTSDNCTNSGFAAGQVITAMVGDNSDPNFGDCFEASDKTTGLACSAFVSDFGTVITISEGGSVAGAFTTSGVNDMFSTFAGDTGSSIAFGLAKILAILAALVGMGVLLWYMGKLVGGMKGGAVYGRMGDNTYYRKGKNYFVYNSTSRKTRQI